MGRRVVFRTFVPYIWTENAVQAINDLLSFEEQLSDEDKEVLKKSFDELIIETSRIQVAARKTKILLCKATEGTITAFRDITVDIISEVAKKHYLVID